MCLPSLPVMRLSLYLVEALLSDEISAWKYLARNDKPPAPKNLGGSGPYISERSPAAVERAATVRWKASASAPISWLTQLPMQDWMPLLYEQFIRTSFHGAPATTQPSRPVWKSKKSLKTAGVQASHGSL